MTTVITPVNLSDLNTVADMMAESFAPTMWGFCGDCIYITYDDEKKNELYNVWTKLDFLEFALGMDGIELDFQNGPGILAGMLEAYELEQMLYA